MGKTLKKGGLVSFECAVCGDAWDTGHYQMHLLEHIAVALTYGPEASTNPVEFGQKTILERGALARKYHKVTQADALESRLHSADRERCDLPSLQATCIPLKASIVVVSSPDVTPARTCI